MILDLAEQARYEALFETPLDCSCKGDGFILSEQGVPLHYCPKHILCAFDESYRLDLLRDVYRNIRTFLLKESGTTLSAREFDDYLRNAFRLDEESSAQDWVRSIQSIARQIHILSKLNL